MWKEVNRNIKGKKTDKWIHKTKENVHGTSRSYSSNCHVKDSLASLSFMILTDGPGKFLHDFFLLSMPLECERKSKEI